jgi:hypothetical protein
LRYDAGVRPLADWRYDANRLDEIEFCAAHPHPLLVHCTTGYQLRPVERIGLTIDRAVLAPSSRPAMAASGLDDYRAALVKPRAGRRGFQLAIGCELDCDIHIDDVTVSTLHAHMTQDRHGNWYVQDAGSTTGTHVNDRDPCETQVLRSGDRISLGMVDLVFYLPSQVYHLIRRLL